MSEITVRQMILKCFEYKAIIFGDFIIKSRLHSPYYIDIRSMCLDFQTQQLLSDLMYAKIQSSGVSYDLICGVPYTTLPIAVCISSRYQKRLILKKKESKDYGTKRMVEGIYSSGDKVIIIEDFISSGTTILETVMALRGEGLVVTDAFVFFDGQQDGVNNVKEFGINVHCLIDVKTTLDYLRDAQIISSEKVIEIMDFIHTIPLTINEDIINEYRLSLLSNKTTKLLSYEERSELSTHPLTKALFNLMVKKKSNLCIAIDMTDWHRIIDLAKTVGQYAVIVKLHIDIIENFEYKFIEELTAIAKELEFFIFEDRKFSDIGRTVGLQYNKGIYRISSWTHIVSAHLLSGSEVIEGLKANQKESGKGCLLVTSMSSKGSEIDNKSIRTAYMLSKKYNDFVIGFISQSRVSSDQTFIHMTPGIRTDDSTDGFITPEEAVQQRGADVIIVGRSITYATDPQLAAQLYQKRGFEAYLSLY